MDIVGEITKTTLEEIQKVLTSRTVVGEPISVEGATIIPLVNAGFGFGAGGGSGKGESSKKGEGAIGVTGGGAWVRPVALVIIDSNGVRVEPVQRGLTSVVENLTNTVPKVVEKFIDKKKDKDKDASEPEKPKD